MASYYDYILATIPTLFVGGLFVGSISSITVQMAVATAAIISIPFIGHALFVRAPTSATKKVEKVTEQIAHKASEGARPVKEVTKNASKAAASKTEPMKEVTKNAGKAAASKTEPMKEVTKNAGKAAASKTESIKEATKNAAQSTEHGQNSPVNIQSD